MIIILNILRSQRYVFYENLFEKNKYEISYYKFQEIIN